MQNHFLPKCRQGLGTKKSIELKTLTTVSSFKVKANEVWPRSAIDAFAGKATPRAWSFASMCNCFILAAFRSDPLKRLSKELACLKHQIPDSKVRSKESANCHVKN